MLGKSSPVGESEPTRTSIDVSAGSIAAGRDVVIARGGGPRDYRSFFSLGSIAFLSIFLSAWLWPLPREAAVDLELVTSHLRFRLHETQPAFGLPLAALNAPDVEEIYLPPSAAAVEDLVRESERARRLGIQLERRVGQDGEGTFALERSMIPAGSEVSMSSAGQGRVELSLDGFRQQVFVSILGPYRFRILRLLSKPSEWIDSIAKAPEVLGIEPRSGRLVLSVEGGPRGGEEYFDSVRIDRLRLHESHRIESDEGTFLEEDFEIRGGTIRIAQEDTVIGNGSELRIESAMGILSDVRSTGEGLSLRFQGSARKVTAGPVDRAVVLAPRTGIVHSVLMGATGGLAILSGTVSLVLNLSVILGRLRIASSNRFIRRSNL